jgi:hypothetical protein
MCTTWSPHWILHMFCTMYNVDLITQFPLFSFFFVLIPLYIFLIYGVSINKVLQGCIILMSNLHLNKIVSNVNFFTTDLSCPSPKYLFWNPYHCSLVRIFLQNSFFWEPNNCFLWYSCVKLDGTCSQGAHLLS